MTSLGLDIGTRRIGLALSDPEDRVAVPLGAVEERGRGAQIAAIQQLVAEHGVERVVVGLPLGMDGSFGPQAARARRLAEVLEQALAVPVVTWDERLTTVSAARSLRPMRGGRATRGRVDALAAATILQGYLDHRRGSGLSG